MQKKVLEKIEQIGILNPYKCLIYRVMYDLALRSIEYVDFEKYVKLEGDVILIQGAKYGAQSLVNDVVIAERVRRLQQFKLSNDATYSKSKLYRNILIDFSNFKRVDNERNSVTHLFRHAKAKEIYLQTSDIEAVKYYLREKTTEATMYYIDSKFEW